MKIRICELAAAGKSRQKGEKSRKTDKKKERGNAPFEWTCLRTRHALGASGSAESSGSVCRAVAVISSKA